MAFKLHEPQTMPKDELVEHHDQAAEYVAMGVDYFLDELHRRDQMTAIRSSARLSAIGIMLSTIATIAAILALFLR